MKSLEELARIREQAKQNLQLRESRDGIKIVVGMGTCGIAAGARETMNAILDELNKRNLSQVIVTQTGCVGLCEQELHHRCDPSGSAQGHIWKGFSGQSPADHCQPCCQRQYYRRMGDSQR